MKKLLCKLIVYLICKFHLLWQIEYTVEFPDPYNNDYLTADTENHYVIAPSLEYAREKIEKSYSKDKGYSNIEFKFGGGAIIITETNEIY